MTDTNTNATRQLGLMVLTAGLYMGAMATGAAQAADFGVGGDCCADLEERVAELEATTARKGNRKVSLTVSGRINQGLLIWDDGYEQNAYVVTNLQTDSTQFRFTGEAQITPGWSAGFKLEIDERTGVTGSVSQIDDNTIAAAGPRVTDSWFFIKNERLGQVSLGLVSQASDGASEVDLSGTDTAAYANVANLAGGFFARRSGVPGNGGLLQNVTLADFMDNFAGEEINEIRYDSPTFAGFTFVASWGEDDIWDAGVYYEKTLNSIQLAGAVVYTSDHDEGGIDGLTAPPGFERDADTVAGSVSVLHTPTGLNFTFAAGTRAYNGAFVDNRGVMATRNDDPAFYYLKGGLKKNWFSTGETAFYGEYGHYDDYLGNDAGPAVVAGLDANNGAAGICTGAGVACLVSGSDAHIWGLGVVQYIDAAAMQVYAGYRHHEIDAGLVDSGGAGVAAGPLQDFDTVLVGGLIEF